MPTAAFVPRVRPVAASSAEMQRVVALFAGREYAAAEKAARKLTRRFPRDGFGWKALATVLAEQERWEEALRVFERSGPSLRDDAEFANNHARTLRQAGRLDDACREYARAIALRPGYVEAHDNLGVLLQEADRLAEAEQCFLSALAYRPAYVPALEHLGNVCMLLGENGRAEKAYRAALELAPQSFQVHNNLGSMLQGMGRHAEAEVCFRTSLGLAPGYAPGWNSLGYLLAAHGMHGDAELCFREALRLDPFHTVAHSNLLFSMTHRVTTTPQALLAEHVAFADRFEKPLRAQRREHGNSRDPERPLRLGFLSGDLHDHALVRYLKPTLELLAEEHDLSLVAFANDRIEDAVTAELKTLFDAWHGVSLLSDERLAELIRSERVDILFDLSGHTGFNRLLALARKPAPLQIGWIGYVGTSGMDAIDYFIADRHFVPRAMETQFTEKMMHLPACTPFRPFADSPEVNASPALATGTFTFASFHRVMKLEREVIATWGEILRGSPHSRLMLANMPDEKPPARLLAWFAEENIARERLQFVAARGVKETLSLHHQVDLSLDAFPYSGSTTNNHALWMGVPTLTWPRGIVASRMGAALALQVGLGEFVAESREDYIAKAVAHAEDPSRLATLRPACRRMFAESVLQQPEVLERALVASLRLAWRRWCAGLPPERIACEHAS